MGAIGWKFTRFNNLHQRSDIMATSTISTIDTSGLLDAVVLRTNRIGKVVSVTQIGDIGQMIELADLKGGTE